VERLWRTAVSCARATADGGSRRGGVAIRRVNETHAQRFVLVLRGTPKGLEILLEGPSFAAAWSEVALRLAERPAFYRGTLATAVLAVAPASDEEFALMLGALRELGIDLRGISGDARIEALAARHDRPYLGPARRRAARPGPRLAVLDRAIRPADSGDLTHAARSLDADFAGARADFVQRRARIVAARERVPGAPAPHPSPRGQAVATLPSGPATLYHRGHLRGGQALQNVGSIVVLGDVNPGAELTAGGDILVFGALRGTAHAGAQGDAGARVIALDLRATQLRIATFIAAGAESARRSRGGLQPEVAFVDAERIAIAAYDDARVPR